MDKIKIRFVKPYSPYVVGDITAKFEKDAKRYLAVGVAEKVEVADKQVESPVVDKQVKKPRRKK